MCCPHTGGNPRSGPEYPRNGSSPRSDRIRRAWGGAGAPRIVGLHFGVVEDTQAELVVGDLAGHASGVEEREQLVNRAGVEEWFEDRLQRSPIAVSGGRVSEAGDPVAKAPTPKATRSDCQSVFGERRCTANRRLPRRAGRGRSARAACGRGRGAGCRCRLPARLPSMR